MIYCARCGRGFKTRRSLGVHTSWCRNPERVPPIVRDPAVRERAITSLREGFKTGRLSPKNVGTKLPEETKRRIREALGRTWRRKLNLATIEDTSLIYNEEVMDALFELKLRGYRVIPTSKVVPDGVAIMGEKVYFVELEGPKTEDYKEVKRFYDGKLTVSPNRAERLRIRAKEALGVG